MTTDLADKTPSATANCRFPTEICLVIFGYLHNPIPLPLSKPARSALRQPHLCAIARTCQEFYNLIQPLLHQDIVTDQFHLLLDQLNNPHRLERFAATKTLRIEYMAKPEAVEMTYEWLFNLGEGERSEKGMRVWEKCGWRAGDAQWWLWGQCHKEAGWLQRNLGEITLPLSSILPNLESVAVASIYGLEAQTWRAATKYAEKYRKAVFSVTPTCQRLFHRFLSTGNLRSLCLRDPDGPLAVPDAEDKSPDSNLPATTIQHFHADPCRLPYPYDHPTRWMYEGAADADWAVLVRKIKRRFAYIYWVHPQILPGLPLDLTISCSTNQSSTVDLQTALSTLASIPATSDPLPLSASEQRVWAGQFEVNATELLCRYADNGLVINEGDSVKWQSAADSAPCEACGSCCPV